MTFIRFDLHKPIGVFDAGIGSYGIVQVIRRRYPKQDILYFADRASFPYGAKSHSELADCVGGAIGTLVRFGASAVVLASNAPSVMVLDEIRDKQPVPVLGVYPPVAQALRNSRSGVVAVLGVQSLVRSPEIRAYVEREGGGAHVALVNASALVQRVEDGSFLSDPATTQIVVDEFVEKLKREHAGLDTCTLSSTHLPWLASFFRKAAPDIAFLDPADSLAPRLQPYTSEGSGTTVCLATETRELPLADLRRMLRLIGVNIEPRLVAT